MSSYYIPPHLNLSRLHKWLDTTRSFDSHYGGFLFNHLAHNFVVFEGSNSCVKRSPEHVEAKHQWWSDFYISENSLEKFPARIIDASMPSITQCNWQEHLDRTLINYPAYLKYFDEELLSSNGQTIGEVVKNYVPVLGRGLVGSALHGVIHLGFGVEANHKGMVSEGLANMCTVFLPIAERETEPIKLWVPSSQSADSKGVLGTAKAYLESAVSGNAFQRLRELSIQPEYLAQNIGAFQRKVLAINDPIACDLADELNNHFPVNLPDTVSGENEVMSLFPAVREAQALIAAAYIASDCEFFVVHGVTSLHAVLVLMQHLTPEQQRDLLVHWLRTVLVVYVAQNTPGLHKLLALLEIWQSRESQCQESECNEHLNSEALWGTRLSLSQLSTDEHVSKAVYALWRWSHWHHQRPHSVKLFEDAIDHQLRPLPETGEVLTPHAHLWFSN